MNDNILTSAEREMIIAMYPNFNAHIIHGSNSKITLKAIAHLTDVELLNACKAYDPLVFALAYRSNITIKEVENRKKIKIGDTGYSCLVDLSSGAISSYNKGTHLWPYDGGAIHLTQWYLRNSVAIPLYFESGHWANGKTAIELGVAVPDKYRLDEILKLVYNKDQEVIDEWYFDKKCYGIDLNDLSVLNGLIEGLSEKLKLAA